MRQLQRKAAQRSLIVAIVNDRYFSQQQILRFARLIRQRAEHGMTTSADDLRNQLTCGRRLAIQILEFFDRCGFTRRRDNDHLLCDALMFNPNAEPHSATGTA